MHRTLRCAAIAALCLLAVGCIKGEVDVTVRGDGSGEVVVEVFPGEDVAEMLRTVDVQGLIDGSFEGAGGVEFEDIESNGRSGYRLSVPFDDVESLSGFMVGGGTVAGRQVTLFSSFLLQELPEDGGWVLDATLNPVGEILGTGGEDSIDASLRELIDAAGRGGESGIDLTVSLPGQLVSSNADSTAGGTATWKLDRPDAPTVLQMRTEPTEFPTPVQMVLGACAAVLLLGALLWVFGATRPQKPNRRARNRDREDDGRRIAATTGWEPTARSPHAPQVPGVSSAPTLPPLAPMPPPQPQPGGWAPEPEADPPSGPGSGPQT